MSLCESCRIEHATKVLHNVMEKGYALDEVTFHTLMGFLRDEGKCHVVVELLLSFWSKGHVWNVITCNISTERLCRKGNS